MAWTAPRTWVTGEVVTAALMNTHVRDDLRYLKGLDGGVTIEDDLDIGANLLKTTNLSLKEGTSSIWYLRTAADDAYVSILGNAGQFSIFQARTGTTFIDCRDVDTNYIAGRARDSGSGLVEIFRMVGAADPYFQMTLPQVLTPGTAPGTLVEGHFWYLAADDKLYYKDATANIELVGINAPTRGDVLYRGASNWLNLAKGNAGEFLKQGANDPEWAQGVATREVFFPITGINNTGSLGAVGDFIINILTAGNYCYFNFKTPHDFVSLTHCKVLGIPDGTGTIDWTATTDFAAIGEAYNTNSDSDTANGLAMTDTEIEEVDISAAFTALAAEDYVGVKFLVDAVGTLTSYRVIGLVLRYT